MDAQLKKGLIEICVLVVLKQQDSYGYQIIDVYKRQPPTVTISMGRFPVPEK